MTLQGLWRENDSLIRFELDSRDTAIHTVELPIFAQIDDDED